MKKLENKGRFLKMINGIYRKTGNKVVTEEGMSEKFRTKRGVRRKVNKGDR